MKLLTFSLLSSLILSVSALPSSTTPSSKRQTATLNAATDRLLFSSTMSQFQAARNARNPSGLDWTSDGCSSSPDNPLGFNFVPSCQRHDFGYRNYKRQNRFEAGKARIDSNFRNDMYDQCTRESPSSACRVVADIYYNAVKNFGGREIPEEMTEEDVEKKFVEAVLAGKLEEHMKN